MADRDRLGLHSVAAGKYCDMDTVTVHTANSAAEAEIVAGLLREQGFEVITRVESPYTDAPTEGGEGTVSIDVPLADADTARRLLEARQNQF